MPWFFQLIVRPAIFDTSCYTERLWCSTQQQAPAILKSAQAWKPALPPSFLLWWRWPVDVIACRPVSFCPRWTRPRPTTICSPGARTRRVRPCSLMTSACKCSWNIWRNWRCPTRHRNTWHTLQSIIQCCWVEEKTPPAETSQTLEISKSTNFILGKGGKVCKLQVWCSKCWCSVVCFTFHLFQCSLSVKKKQQPETLFFLLCLKKCSRWKEIELLK